MWWIWEQMVRGSGGVWCGAGETMHGMGCVGGGQGNLDWACDFEEVKNGRRRPDRGRVQIECKKNFDEILLI